MVSHHVGKTSEAFDSHIPVLKVKLYLFNLVGQRVLLGLLLFLFGLLFTKKHLVYLLLLLASAKVSIGFAVEEHNIDVSLGTPAAVAAEAVFVAFPGHGLAAQCPAEVSVGVSAAGEVCYFST